MTISDVTIQDISHSSSSVIGLYLLDNTSITNLTMSGIGRFGIYADATVAAAAITLDIDGLDYTGKDSATEIDYAVEVMNGVQMTMTNSSIINCSGNAGYLCFGGYWLARPPALRRQPQIFKLQIQHSQTNFINVALGMSASENGTTASASGCDFNITTGGYQIDSYSASTLNFENNYWNTTSATEISDAINLAGAGSVDYVPFYMDAGMTTTSDNYLSNLAFSAGTLDSAFDAEDLAYVLTVPFENATITVTPTAIDSGCNHHGRWNDGGKRRGIRRNQF